MNPNRRTVVVALATVVVVVEPAAAQQVKSWNAAAGNWGVAGNWSPVGVPTPSNFVNVGNTAPAENAFVTLNVSSSILSLTITDGMRVLGAGLFLVVAGGLTMSDINFVAGRGFWASGLRVSDGPAPDDVVAGAVAMSNGAWLEMDDGTLHVANSLTLELGTAITGAGTIIVSGDDPVAMLMDGSITVGVGTMTLVQDGEGRIDLDGSFDSGVLQITESSATGAAKLVIQGVGLADDMGDSIFLSSGNQLNMDLDEGWTMAPGTTLRFLVSDNGGPSVVTGSLVTINGSITAPFPDAHLLMAGPVTFAASASADLASDCLLEFDNTTTFEGGDYTLDDGAIMHFQSETIVEGGTFTSASPSLLVPALDFDGATTYHGTVVINGVARQSGDAFVNGPTTIDAEVFDMDGSSGATTWIINHNLVVNGLIETGPPVFEGTMTIMNTLPGKLTINADSPSASWVSEGTLNLGGAGLLMVTRIAGAHLDVHGEMNITGPVQISADTELLADSSVSFTTNFDRLRFSGETFVDDDCLFVGGGRLENAATGDMTLAQGTNLLSTDLQNLGTLRLGTSPGLAIVDEVTFGSTSNWVVELGGPSPGFQHDQLIAGGTAELDGTLEVQLIDLGGGVFDPDVGDEFTILTTSSLSGAFTNEPITKVADKTYVWSVSYEAGPPNSVKLTLADVLSCPPDLNGDDVVDAADLAILLGAWGPCPGCAADLDDDDTVGGADLAIVLGGWGVCP